MTRILAAVFAVLIATLSMETAMADPADKSIVYLGEMHAKAGQGQALYDYMQKQVPPLDITKGLQIYDVLRNDKDPDRVVIIEIWDSKADHDAAVKNIDKDAIKMVMGMLDKPPSGETFNR